MRLLAQDIILMKEDIFQSAKELLSVLKGFVNCDPNGASEFHGRVRSTCQDRDFVGGVWNPLSEGLKQLMHGHDLKILVDACVKGQKGHSSNYCKLNGRFGK